MNYYNIVEDDESFHSEYDANDENNLVSFVCFTVSMIPIVHCHKQYHSSFLIGIVTILLDW